MDRKQLIDSLSLLEPGLNDEAVPIMACFCFGAKSVHSYNDVLALELPYSKDFNPSIKDVALRGKVFLQWLRACSGKDVTLELDGTEITAKCGRSKMTFTTLGKEDFQFEQPSTEDAKWIEVDDGFIDALKIATTSMGTDVSNPWRLGITLKGGKKGYMFFATDNRSAVKVFYPCPDPSKVAITLPVRFCELLRTYGAGVVKLGLGEGWCQAHMEDGLVLFSKTINQTDVAAFQEQFAVEVEGLIEVPKGLEACMDRAKIVLPLAKDQHSELSVKNGKLFVITRSSGPMVRDSISIQEHAPIQVLVEPSVVARALKHTNQFGITENFLLFKGKNVTYLITTRQSEAIVEENPE